MLFLFLIKRLKLLENINKAITQFVTTNKVVNAILLIAIFIIVGVEVSSNMPVLLGLDVDTINYYFNILVNLAIGYIVSTVFYVLVVYYPERKRKYLVQAKTSILFARLQTNLNTVIRSVVESANVKLDAECTIPKKYTDIIKQLDLIELMRQKQVEDPVHGKRFACDDFVRASNNIENLKSKLIPFIAYLEPKELELYADLEEILIFENVNDLDGFPPKSYLLVHDFSFIVAAYYDCQKLVQKGKCELVSWQP
ncbi:hypothetical protein DLR59_18680 [Vibrio tarriae]|nr:hypothetical protein DLR59_18680 [Vibrio tarriae]